MHYPNHATPKDCHWLVDDRNERAMAETLLGSSMETLLLDLFKDVKKNNELWRAIRVVSFSSPARLFKVLSLRLAGMFQACSVVNPWHCPALLSAP